MVQLQHTVGCLDLGYKLDLPRLSLISKIDFILKNDQFVLHATHDTTTKIKYLHAAYFSQRG